MRGILQTLVLLFLWTSAAGASSCDDFLRQKAEEREAAGWSEVPASIREALIVSENDRFMVDTLNDRALKQFHLNRLQAAYYRASEAWKREELKALGLGDLSHIQIKVGGAVLDSYFPPFGLADSMLTFETARQVFAGKPWTAFPWAKALELVQKYADAHGDFSLFDFNQGIGKTDLPVADQHRLAQSYSRADSFRLCCKSDPGCTACPLNRQALRPRGRR